MTSLSEKIFLYQNLKFLKGLLRKNVISLGHFVVLIPFIHHVQGKVRCTRSSSTVGLRVVIQIRRDVNTARRIHTRLLFYRFDFYLETDYLCKKAIVFRRQLCYSPFDTISVLSSRVLFGMYRGNGGIILLPRDPPWKHWFIIEENNNPIFMKKTSRRVWSFYARSIATTSDI